MRNIKLTIAYDGTNYCGWQRQKNGLSVQELLERALRKILREKITVIGSGRTDAGVHSRGQTLNFRTRSSMGLESIKKALNANLPEDISVTGIRTVGMDFNARFNAKSKVYRYLIYTSETRSPFDRRYSLYVPYGLNISAMGEAANYLLGKHDFSSFKAAHGSAKTSIRTIKHISVRKKGKMVIIDIEADGFLYNMVRAIVGTLVEIGRGRWKPAKMKKIVASKNRFLAGPTVSAKGLTLVRVRY